MWNKILEVVKKESEVQPTVDSIDHYYHSSWLFLKSGNINECVNS
jgi:hypothetical protein